MKNLISVGSLARSCPRFCYYHRCRRRLQGPYHSNHVATMLCIDLLVEVCTGCISPAMLADANVIVNVVGSSRHGHRYQQYYHGHPPHCRHSNASVAQPSH